MSDVREDMRRLINLIEKGASSTNVDLAVADIKMLANTVSNLANQLDARLRQKSAKKTAKTNYVAPVPAKPKSLSRSQPRPTFATDVDPFPKGLGAHAVRSDMSQSTNTLQANAPRNSNTSF